MNIDRDLLKHHREFAAALRNHKYEVSESGVYFPKQKVFARGEYVHDVNGRDERVDCNLVVTEGMNHILSVALAGGSQIGTWYFALYSQNISPVSTWTAANFASTATEIVSTTEGYVEPTRQAFVEGTPSGGSINNTANKAAFTIATASQVNVWGAALLSSSVRGGTSGVLLSAAKFSAVRQLFDSDVFNLGYTLTLSST